MDRTVELLRQTLPHLEKYASMLRRKGNQPALEAEVRRLIEECQRSLMETR